MSLQFPKPAYAKAKRRAKRQKQTALSAAIEAVWARERSRCRVCGFRVQRGLAGTGLPSAGEVHHIVKRSQSKALRESTSNMVLLDKKCHDDAEARRLIIAGNADETLTWERK